MMKRILFLLTGLILLVACQENVEPKDPEFDNWKARNEAAFKTHQRGPTKYCDSQSAIRQRLGSELRLQTDAKVFADW